MLIVVIGWSLASILFVLGGCRLSVQSSYYADPARRFCGTLDHLGTWVEHSFKLTLYYLAALVYPLRKAIGITLVVPEKPQKTGNTRRAAFIHGLRLFGYYPATLFHNIRNVLGTLWFPVKPVRDTSKLGFYSGVRQWWWRSTPTSNLRAKKRFQERRKSMELPEWDFMSPRRVITVGLAVSVLLGILVWSPLL